MINMIDNEIIIDTNKNKNNFVDNCGKEIIDDETSIEDNEEFKTIIREKLKFNANLDLVSLKYLYKLLKFYKLEHYMSDLIDYGFCTAMSLNELNSFYYEKLNVSAYDLKKFSKLQVFIKQVMSTLNNTTSNNSNKFAIKPTKQQATKNLKYSSSTSTLATTPFATSSSSSSGNNIGVPKWENKINKMVQQKSSLNKRPNSRQLLLSNTNSKSNTNTNNNNNNNNIKRSKSVEPKNTDDEDGEKVIEQKVAPSVCHPAPLTYISQKYKKSKGSYFGPQLKSNQIEHVEMKNYNYGVPNKQQQPQIEISSKKIGAHRSVSSSASNKQRKPMIVSESSNLNGEKAFEMADIYVFARKRPMLACESKLNDAVIVEDQTIVINQAKCAVDGTEILRQVSI